MCRRSTGQSRPNPARRWTRPTSRPTGGRTRASLPPASMPSGLTRGTGSISSNGSSGISSTTKGPCRRRRTCGRGACSGTATPALRDGAGGSGRRHGIVVEDTRGPDRRRPQLLAEHRAVLGLGHRRLLRRQRTDGRVVRALAPVRGVLRVLPLTRANVVAPASLGVGLERDGPAGAQHTNTPIPTDDRRNVLQSEMNNPAIEPVVKRYSELRYQLMPYTYTLGWEAHQTGMPLMRAMWLHYPHDAAARPLGMQYMWGRDMLIAPVFEKGAMSWAVYLPAGTWYDWWTNATHAGGQTVTRRGPHNDADLRPGRSDHPVGPRPAVHGPGDERAHDAPRVPRRGRPIHAERGRRHQPGLPGGKRRPA
jgi:hypothetical protein